MSEYWLSIVVGSLIAGGGLTAVIVGALMNKLRDKFVEKGEALTIEDIRGLESRLEEKGSAHDLRWVDAMEKLEHRMREHMNTIVGSLDIRIMQRHEQLQKDLDRLASTVERAADMSYKAEQLSREALHQAESAMERTTALEKLLDSRLGHIQELLEDRRKRA